MQRPYRYRTPEEVIAAAVNLMEKSLTQKDAFTSVEAVKQFLRLRLGTRDSEYFCVMFLDSQHQLLAAEDMFRGTIDGASVYPREVVKAALAHNAAAVIFSHNHPSGCCEPSSADRSITERLTKALALHDIRVLDHLVVSAQDAVSFAERGWI